MYIVRMKKNGKMIINMLTKYESSAKGRVDLLNFMGYYAYYTKGI